MKRRDEAQKVKDYEKKIFEMKQLEKIEKINRREEQRKFMIDDLAKRVNIRILRKEIIKGR